MITRRQLLKQTARMGIGLTGILTLSGCDLISGLSDVLDEMADDYDEMIKKTKISPKGNLINNNKPDEKLETANPKTPQKRDEKFKLTDWFIKEGEFKWIRLTEKSELEKMSFFGGGSELIKENPYIMNKEEIKRNTHLYPRDTIKHGIAMYTIQGGNFEENNIMLGAFEFKENSDIAKQIFSQSKYRLFFVKEKSLCMANYSKSFAKKRKDKYYEFLLKYAKKRNAGIFLYGNEFSQELIKEGIKEAIEEGKWKN